MRVSCDYVFRGNFNPPFAITGIEWKYRSIITEESRRPMETWASAIIRARSSTAVCFGVSALHYLAADN